MDRSTLIIVLIVVLIVMNMGSSTEHFSTRVCKDRYNTYPNPEECPENCKNVKYSPVSGNYSSDKVWKCVP